MLSAIASFATRFRGVVIALAILIVAYGILALSHARWNVFPEFAPPQAKIDTAVPGFAAEQVETLVTRPLEDALSGTAGLAVMRSRSIQGLSIITLTFKPGSDLTRVRESIAERLTRAAAELPKAAQTPVIRPLSSSARVVMTIGITSKTQSPMALRTFADWTLKPQLLSVPGVSDVSIYGGAVKQVQIQVHRSALARLGLSFNDVIAAARRVTANIGLGFVKNANQRIVLIPEGVPQTAKAISAVVLKSHDGQTLRLGDVATVTDGAAPRTGAGSVMGKPGIVLVVSQQYGANTLKVSNALEQRLHALAPAMSRLHIRLYPALFRPANFIETAIGHLGMALLIGAGLVIGVLFLFLRHTRAALISAVAIPLSLLIAIVVLERLGFGLNTMTLGGLAIAIGEVVDDAIIDVENILRRLRLNRAAPAPRPAWHVVVAASLEVRSAVIYATFIVALIFVPVLTLSGVAGRLFSPLGLAYIASIFASLAVALTVTPALSLALLPHDAAVGEPRVQTWLKARYNRLLTRIEQRPRTIITSVIFVCLMAVGTLPFLQTEFLPHLHEGNYIIHMRLAPGASLEASQDLGRRITKALLKLPSIRSVAQRTGRANRVEDPSPIFANEFDVALKPLSSAGQERTLRQIRQTLRAFTGPSFAVNTFLTERIEETLSGYTAPVIVNIFGNNLDVIDRKAEEVAAILSKLPGASNVQMEAPQNEPQMAVRLRIAALNRYGIAPTDVLDTVQAAYSGARVGQVVEGSRLFDVDVTLPPSLQRAPAQLGHLPITAPDGRQLPLSDLADLTMTNGRFMILHEDGQRVAPVTVNLQGVTPSRFVARARKALAKQIHWPAGVYAIFAGNAKAQATATRELLVYAGLAVAGIVLLLYLSLRSLRAVGLVLVNLPFALVGGVAVAALSGGMLSLGGLVGFVTLFGISVRNSIMLVSHYHHLVEQEGEPWTMATVLRGASERLIPILMTALVTALGLAPLALTSGAPGNEIEGPMAAVILGGLVTSTALNLLVLPTLASRWLFFAGPRPEANTQRGI